MTPGEIHAIHTKVVAELAAARAEIDRLQREVDELDAALIRERSFLASREGEPQPRGRTAEQRLRLIRLHLAGVDVEKLARLLAACSALPWVANRFRRIQIRQTDGAYVIESGGSLGVRKDIDAVTIVELFNASTALIGAAREATRP